MALLPLSPANRVRASFFLHAVGSGSLYSRIADIQHTLGVNEATLGLAFLGFPLGTMLVFLVGSRVVEIFGTRPVNLVGLTLLPIATALLAAMPNVWALFAMFLVYAAIYSLPNMAVNVEADRVEAQTGRRIMNSCHGVWSVGYLLTSGLGTAAVAAHLSPVLHMSLVAVPLVPLSLWVLGGQQPAPPRPHSARKVRNFALPTLAVLLLVAFTFGPNLLEGALRNWSVIYMRESFTAPGWVDTLTLPVFLLAQSIGRLSGDRLVTRFGPTPVARALIVLAFAGCVAITLAPNLVVALLGFLLVGVGVCLSYPLTTSAVARLGDRPASQNVAALTLAIQVTQIAAPPVMGLIATGWGIRAVFGIILPFILASIWLARFLTSRSAAAPLDETAVALSGSGETQA